MSSLQKTILKSKLPPSGFNLPVSSSRPTKARAMQRKRDYDATTWEGYFDKSQDVKIGDNTFHIYITGTEGPTLVLLHGGGYGALTWAEFTKSIVSMVSCKVLAMDLRGHGDSHTNSDEDLEVETLAADVAEVIKEVAHDDAIILVGHSMGGAVAVHAAPLIHNLAGLTIIDVVEGTAMDALASMQSFLRSRPSSFSSISQAIEWCVRSGQIRNATSAKVSVPSQIKNIHTGKLATHEIEELHDSSTDEPEDGVDTTIIQRNDVIQEEEDSPTPMPPPTNSKVASTKKYAWRIDLAKTERYWSGWFKGLSAAFLNIGEPKMLLLAGVDRLDRELTVGQMQGKFQMQVLPACGHAVHEDVPDKVAEAVATFLVRHKFAEPLTDFPRTFGTC